MRAAAITTFALVCCLAAVPAFAQNSLNVNAAAAINSTGTACGGQPCGLQVNVVDNTSDAYVQSDHPNGEKTFTARFWIDPTNFNIPLVAGSNSHRFMRFNNQGCCQLVIGFLTRSTGSGNFRTIWWGRNDALTFQLLAAQFLTSGVTPTPQHLEVTWTAASAPGANDGSFTLTNLGSAASTGRNDLDNDTQEIDRVQVGTFVGSGSGTGNYYFDEYESFR